MDESELIARAREGDCARLILYQIARTESTRTKRQREPNMGEHSEGFAYASTAEAQVVSRTHTRRRAAAAARSRRIDIELLPDLWYTSSNNPYPIHDQ